MEAVETNGTFAGQSKCSDRGRATLSRTTVLAIGLETTRVSELSFDAAHHFPACYGTEGGSSADGSGRSRQLQRLAA